MYLPGLEAMSETRTAETAEIASKAISAIELNI
jgi:hypothetical protein